MARAVNLSPVNSPRKTGKFATDFYEKFDGEPSKAAAENVKFERETRIKTLASPQIKFDPSASPKRKLFSLTNLIKQTTCKANQTRVNLTSSERSETYVDLALNLTKRH